MTYKPDKNKKCTFQKMGQGKSFERARLARAVKSDTKKEKEKQKKIAKDKERRLKEWKSWWG